ALVEDLPFAAHHEGQGAVDGFGLAARDGGVQHLDPFLGQGGGDLLGGDRVDRTAVDEDAARLHVGRNAVVGIAQHDLPDLGAVGQHGDDHVAAFADLSLGRTPGAGGLQLLDGSLAAVV